jgi:hypothetical protein
MAQEPVGSGSLRGVGSPSKSQALLHLLRKGAPRYTSFDFRPSKIRLVKAPTTTAATSSSKPRLKLSRGKGGRLLAWPPDLSDIVAWRGKGCKVWGRATLPQGSEHVAWWALWS